MIYPHDKSTFGLPTLTKVNHQRREANRRREDIIEGMIQKKRAAAKARLQTKVSRMVKELI